MPAVTPQNSVAKSKRQVLPDPVHRVFAELLTGRLAVQREMSRLPGDQMPANHVHSTGKTDFTFIQFSKCNHNGLI